MFKAPFTHYKSFIVKTVVTPLEAVLCCVLCLVWCCPSGPEESRVPLRGDAHAVQRREHLGPGPGALPQPLLLPHAGRPGLLWRPGAHPRGAALSQ